MGKNAEPPLVKGLQEILAGFIGRLLGGTRGLSSRMPGERWAMEVARPSGRVFSCAVSYQMT